MPILVTITGPIAAGKNTVAALLAERCSREGHTVVIADVDDVAAMVGAPGAAASGLWFAAHEAHGGLVAQWMRSAVNVVISVGPIYTEAEQAALFGPLPPGARLHRVLIDAPLSVTWERVSADQGRGLSRQREFHEAAHARFRSLLPGIPSDLVFNSGDTSAGDIVSAIWQAISPSADEPAHGFRRAEQLAHPRRHEPLRASTDPGQLEAARPAFGRHLEYVFQLPTCATVPFVTMSPTDTSGRMT